MAKITYTENQIVYLNGQPCTYIARENRNESWVEKADGTVLRIYTAGLSTAAPAPSRRVRLTVDSSRGTDGAR